MMNFNLLRERKTIHGAVTPKTPIPGGRPPLWRRRSFILMSAFAGALALWMWSIGVEVRINLDQLFGPAQESPPVNTPRAAQKSAKPPAPAVEEPAKEEETAPAGTASAPAAAPPQEEPAPVSSLPVAKDAPAAPPQDAEEAWSARFALCVYRTSCEEVAAILKDKGVDTYIDESSAMILSHRVIIGPWADAPQADKAMGELKAKGVETYPFSSGESFYLSTGSSIDEASMSRIKKLADSMGYRADVSSKKEPQRVFKVYRGRWKDEETARKELADYTSRGIECVLEKH